MTNQNKQGHSPIAAELRRMAARLYRESNAIVARVGLIDSEPDYHRALGLEQARKIIERRATRIEKARKM